MKPITIYNEHWNCERDLKWRQIKFQLQDNTWRQWFNPSSSRLKRLLIKHQPKNVYASVSKWIYFREHGTYKNIFLDSDYIIDKDNKNKKDLDKIKTYMSLDYPSLNLKHQLNTGGGYHLIYKFDKIINDLEFHQELKKLITTDLVNKKFKVDVPVMEDVYRVSRLDETFNGNKNKWCYSLGTKLGQVPNSRMTNQVVKIQPFVFFKEKVGKEIKANLPDHYNLNLISNTVNGTKGLYVPLIRWQKVKKKRLKRLINHYKLGSFFHIKTPKFNYFMFFRCFDAKRLRKIYNFAKSSTISEFEKYKWNWVPVKSSDNFPLTLKFYNAHSPDGNFSKPHLDFFNVKNNKIQCGHGKLKVFKALYSTKEAN